VPGAPHRVDDGCAPTGIQPSDRLKAASDDRLTAPAPPARGVDPQHRYRARPTWEPMPERWESLFARAAEYGVDETAVTEALAEVRDE